MNGRPSMRRGHAATIVAALAFVAAVAVVTTRTINDVEIPGHPELERYGMRDFRDAVYYPAVAWLQGHDPYRPATYRATYPVGSKFPLYIPLTLALHAPFALLPQRAAEVAHFVVNLAAMMGIAVLALAAVGRARDPAWVLGVSAAIVASRPGLTNLFTGECTAYVVCGVFVAMLARRPPIAAAGLALAWMKPTFGLPLTVLLLARGDRRVAVAGTAAAAIVSIAVLTPIIAAEGGVAGFVDAMRANYGTRGESEVYSGASILAIDAGAFVARLVGGTPGAMLDPLDVIATLVVLGVAALAVRRAAAAGQASAPVTNAVIALAVLVGIHHESYDALLVTVPMVALATAAWDPEPRGYLRWVLLALLAVPATNYLATFRAIERFDISGPVWLAVTSVNGGASLAALAICVALAFARPRADRGTTSPAI